MLVAPHKIKEKSQRVDDTKRRQRHNPPDRDGKVSRCYNCGSIFHWARNCPYHKESKPSYKDQVRMQFYMEEGLQTLVGETLSMAILDSGCTKTVCGNTWLECFIETLSNEEKELLTTEPSLTYFIFGDGKMFPSYKTVKLPAEIVGIKVLL